MELAQRGGVWEGNAIRIAADMWRSRKSAPAEKTVRDTPRRWRKRISVGAGSPPVAVMQLVN